MGFQTAVYSRQAPGLAGDFASDNPRDFYPGGPGGLVAGALGTTIGNFAWVNSSSVDWDGGPSIVNSYGYGPVAGIVHRQQIGQIVTFLAEYGLTIQAGNPVSLLTGGDVWLANSGSNQPTIGMKAYADCLTGAVTFGATGSPATATASSATIGAGTTATITGSISGNVLTVTATNNPLYPGSVLSGGGVATGTTIITQLAGGTPNGAGTYTVSPGEQTVAAVTTAIPSLLTSSSVSGTIVLGATVLSSSGTNAGTVIGMGVTAVKSGTEWVVAPALGASVVGTATSGTIVLATSIETKWYAVSSDPQYKVIRCSSHLLG